MSAENVPEEYGPQPEQYLTLDEAEQYLKTIDTSGFLVPIELKFEYIAHHKRLAGIVVATIQAKDRVNGRLKRFQGRSTICLRDGQFTKDAIQLMAFEASSRILTHEMYESFRIDGKLIFDEHEAMDVEGPGIAPPLKKGLDVLHTKYLYALQSRETCQ